MSALTIIALLEGITNLAISFGINVQKYNAMRELSPDNTLTDEQRQELASETRDAVNRL